PHSVRSIAHNAVSVYPSGGFNAKRCRRIVVDAPPAARLAIQLGACGGTPQITDGSRETSDGSRETSNGWALGAGGLRSGPFEGPFEGPVGQHDVCAGTPD